MIARHGGLTKGDHKIEESSTVEWMVCRQPFLILKLSV